MGASLLPDISIDALLDLIDVGMSDDAIEELLAPVVGRLRMVGASYDEGLIDLVDVALFGGATAGGARC